MGGLGGWGWGVSCGGWGGVVGVGGGGGGGVRDGPQIMRERWTSASSARIGQSWWYLDPPGTSIQVAAIFRDRTEGTRRPPESKARRISPPRSFRQRAQERARRGSPLVGQLVREDFNALHFRCLGEQLRRHRRDLLRELALEVGWGWWGAGGRRLWALFCGGLGGGLGWASRPRRRRMRRICRTRPRPHPDREPSRSLGAVARLRAGHRPPSGGVAVRGCAHSGPAI